MKHRENYKIYKLFLFLFFLPAHVFEGQSGKKTSKEKRENYETMVLKTFTAYGRVRIDMSQLHPRLRVNKI